jgi:hypothetical protein
MDNLFDEKELLFNDTVYQQFFGKPAFGGSKTIYSPNSEVIDIDIKRANGEPLAAMIHRGTNSRPLNLQKNTTLDNWSSFSRVFPLCEEMGDITASQINKRMAGENPYDGVERSTRTRLLAREHHMEHIRRYVRLFEALAGSALLTGQHPAISGSNNPDNWYDFRRNASLIVSPAVPWNDPAADILGDIDAGIDTMRQIGKAKPNVIFFAGDVCNVFLNDSVIQTFADILGYSLVRAGSEMFNLPSNLQDLVDAGADPIGRLTTPRGRTLYIMTYDGVYTDDAGVYQKYLPDGTVFMAFYGARCDRYFGPPERLQIVSADVQLYQEMFGMNLNAPVMPANIKGGAIITPAMFYCDAYRSNDAKKISIRTQSAPIFSTTQTDAFYTFTDVLGVQS